MRAWHFVGDTLRDGRPVPADGDWLICTDPVIWICYNGLHASLHPFDALRYAPGPTLCLVECRDIRNSQDDKFVCAERMIVKRMDFTLQLGAFAREQALSVIGNWKCPDVMRHYLETGDAKLRSAAYAAAYAAESAAYAASAYAAESAAYAASAVASAAYAAESAAWSAARSAAWSAARSAARSAAWSAARARFNEIVVAEFSK